MAPSLQQGSSFGPESPQNRCKLLYLHYSGEVLELPWKLATTPQTSIPPQILRNGHIRTGLIFFFLNLSGEELKAKPQIGRMKGKMTVMVTEERGLREGKKEGRQGKAPHMHILEKSKV